METKGSRRSQHGFFTVSRFVASVPVDAGSSYGTALHASTKSEIVLVETVQAFIESLAELHKRAAAYAGKRPVAWRTMNGVSLPGDLQALIKAVINHGQTSLEHADIVVEWQDSNAEWTRVLLELGDLIEIIGTASPIGRARESHKRRLALALAAVDAHFPAKRRKRK